jgi:hypothetical protein
VRHEVDHALQDAEAFADDADERDEGDRGD